MVNLLHPREPVSTWSHGLWLLMSLWGLFFLWHYGRRDRSRQVALLVYGLSLVFCSASSTLYHGLRVPARMLQAFALMDQVSIYMLIAGTYTPIAWTFLQGKWRWRVLGLVWFWALVGVSLEVACDKLPVWLSTTYYLAMGWAAVFCYFEIVRGLSHRTFAPIVAGGVLYSVGAVFNLLHRPVLWPGVVQAHELFHFFVVAASLLHSYFMLTVVAPWVQKSEPRLALATEAGPAGC